jgi:hypothetical protein
MCRRAAVTPRSRVDGGYQKRKSSLCAVIDWDPSAMVQFCTSFSHPFSSVENLYISKRRHYIMAKI